jgi:hypothetical protein
MSAIKPAEALGNLPVGLRSQLVEEFSKITRNYREQRWEAAELDGGRFSEIAYTVLAGYLNGGKYAASASKPPNFEESCRKLASFPSTFPRSARVTVPRVLVGLYDVRNQRGVGHVGGEVSANHMDATFVLHAAQWVMAELVRIFHATDVITATAVVDALVERTVPLIWRVGDVIRVLDPSLNLTDGTLLLLYSAPQGMTDKDLAKNLEQDRLANYRRVLDRLHSSRRAEYNRSNGLVVLLPPGVNDVEIRLL